MANKCALIVDDSTTAQYRLKKMLRPYNLHIDVMDSGEAALRYLAINEPDVIFMDHLMPGMDGFRVLQIIKSHPETAMIPVIMYTSKSGDVYTGQARALGALDVVSKDTINAADLSKVMETIHLYREDESVTKKGSDNEPSNESEYLLPEKSQLTIKEKERALLAESNKVSELKPPKADRRAPSQASIEQARNLELRLSHLELTLEDSRRFITSRVVRELQGLKQNLKQEFGEILANVQPSTVDNAAVSQKKSGGGWAFVGAILMLMLFIFGIYAFKKIDQSLALAQTQQQLVNQQLVAITEQQKNNQLPSALGMDVVAEHEKNLDGTYLDDLAWAFNQSAYLQFNQNNIDIKPLLRLNELLSRIINKGFKGSVLINIYVGNFCLAIDNQGQGQLPSENATMATCMLSSEFYGLDRVLKQYTSDTESALNNLSRLQKKSINIIMAGSQGTDSYPERSPIMAAKDWNAIAQANNRIEVRLQASAH